MLVQMALITLCRRQSCSDFFGQKATDEVFIIITSA